MKLYKTEGFYWHKLGGTRTRKESAKERKGLAQARAPFFKWGFTVFCKEKPHSFPSKRLQLQEELYSDAGSLSQIKSFVTPSPDQKQGDELSKFCCLGLSVLANVLIQYLLQSAKIPKMKFSFFFCISQLPLMQGFKWMAVPCVDHHLSVLTT